MSQCTWPLADFQLGLLWGEVFPDANSVGFITSSATRMETGDESLPTVARCCGIATYFGQTDILHKAVNAENVADAHAVAKERGQAGCVNVSRKSSLTVEWYANREWV